MKNINQNVDLNGTDLPRRLTQLRTQKHLSKSDLAGLAGLSERTIHDLERGKRSRVQEKTLMLLAQALEVNVDDLLGCDLAGVVSGDASTQPHAAPEKSRVNLWWVLAVGCLVLVVAGLMAYNTAVKKATWAINEGTLQVSDGLLGVRLWSLGGNPAVVGCQESPWSDETLLVLIDGKVPAGKVFLALSKATGDTLWTGRADEAVFEQAFGPGTLSGGNLRPHLFRPADLDGDGQPEVLVGFVHSTNSPYVIGWFSSTGDILGQYAHQGHLNSIVAADVDGDGRDEVLASGTTNARAYQGAAMVILDEDHFTGAAVDPLAYPLATVADSSLVRLVLPNFPEPYMKSLQSRRLHAMRIQVYPGEADDSRIRVEFGPDVKMIGILELDSQLRPLGAHMRDDFLESMHTLFPDSLINGTGPADPAWLAQWLDGHYRFQVGQQIH